MFKRTKDYSALLENKEFE